MYSGVVYLLTAIINRQKEVENWSSWRPLCPSPLTTISPKWRPVLRRDTSSPESDSNSYASFCYNRFAGKQTYRPLPKNNALASTMIKILLLIQFDTSDSQFFLKRKNRKDLRLARGLGQSTSFWSKVKTRSSLLNAVSKKKANKRTQTTTTTTKTTKGKEKGEKTNGICLYRQDWEKFCLHL